MEKSDLKRRILTFCSDYRIQRVTVKSILWAQAYFNFSMECQCSGIYEFENGIDKLFGGSNFNKMDSVCFLIEKEN